jgi:hypothetical protein
MIDGIIVRNAFEESIIDKVKWKQSLTLYEKIYCLCIIYYIPIKMMAATLFLMLLSLIPLFYILKTMWIALVISAIISIELVALSYTFLMGLVMFIPSVIAICTFLVVWWFK